MASSLGAETIVCTPSIVFPGFSGYNSSGSPGPNFRAFNSAPFYLNPQFYSQENFNTGFSYPSHSQFGAKSPLAESNAAPGVSPRPRRTKKKKKEILGIFPCGTCGKLYGSRQKLRYHHRVCSSNSYFLCDICSKGFGTESKLEEHMKSHSDERPYSCDVCTLRFTQKNHLARHQKTHSGEKPFLCEACGKRFGRKDKLQRHQMIHSGVRNYGCFICEKSFYRRDKLFNHFKTHKVGEETRCQMCQEPLTADLKSHCCREDSDRETPDSTTPPLDSKPLDSTTQPELQQLISNLVQPAAAAASFQTTSQQNIFLEEIKPYSLTTLTKPPP